MKTAVDGDEDEPGVTEGEQLKGKHEQKHP